MSTQDTDSAADVIGDCMLLRPADAAARLGVTIRALDKWRERHTGPRFVRITPRAIRYPVAALEAWVRERAAATAATADKKRSSGRRAVGRSEVAGCG